MRKSIYSCFFAALYISTPVEAETPVRPYLSLDAARAGAEACFDFARDIDIRIAISIKDRSGRDVLLLRMDDVYQKQIEFAQIKAETASTTPLSTRQIGTVAVSGSALAGLVHVDGITTVEGGLPIKDSDGYSYGGVGVSGAAPAEDGQCAKRAVEAILSHHDP